MGFSFRQLFLCIPFLFAFHACSVQDESLSTDSRRAEKKFQEGLEAYKKSQFQKAEEHLEKAKDIDEDFLEVRSLLGDLYRRSGDMDAAIEEYEAVAQRDPSFHPEALFNLGRLYISRAEYEKAEDRLSRYLELPGKREGIEQKAELKLASARFAQEAIQDPVPFDPVNLGKAINSEQNEYFPCITADRGRFLFTRKIEDERHPRGSHEDFFVSERREGEWQKAENLGAPINSMANEGAPTLSPDGNTLIFTACTEFGSYGPGRSGKGSCDLFVAERKKGRWSAPNNLGKPINTKDWETQPSLSPDGRTLYFVRGNVTMQGIKHQDIYKSVRGQDGNWSEPEELPGTINTSGREESVFIHPDGRTLYFSSDGHPGMGGLDIFYSRKQEEDGWSEPKNLGYPINTEKNENSLMVSPDGKHAYFGSDREDGLGGLDLYRFELPEAVRADPVTYMKGRVLAADSEKPLEADFTLVDLSNGDTVASSSSDPGDGSFLLPLPTGRRYALSVDREGYLFHSENFVLEEERGAADPVKKDVELQNIEEGKNVVLENVFFDTDEYELKEESKVELDKLYRLMKKRPGLRIELQGHTDSRASKEHNKTLSENRAKAVYDHLVQKGIDPDRMTHKGYGEERPIADNSTEEGRAKNRRTAYEVIGN